MFGGLFFLIILLKTGHTCEQKKPNKQLNNWQSNIGLATCASKYGLKRFCSFGVKTIVSKKELIWQELVTPDKQCMDNYLQ